MFGFILVFSVTRRSRSDESHSLSQWVSVSINFTDVTLVSDDTYRRLYWCDPVPDDPDESYLVMKVILSWKLSIDERYLVMKFI